MKKILFLLLAILSGVGYAVADITITVPKKWKGRTLYIWQTDINQAVHRQPKEPINQIRDTVKIKELTFVIPNRLNVATKVNVLSPKKDASDFDHTIGDACVMPDEDVYMTLDDNFVKNEGSLLNQQMAERYTYYMQSMVPYLAAYAREDQDEVARLAKEHQQWYCEWIKNNRDAPGASDAIYQLSDPALVVEYSELLEGDALTSMFYPYAELYISRAKGILERREAQRKLDGKDVKAPDFTLGNLEGVQISLSDFKGKWVILDFWGSWCAPCLKGMPELKEIYSEYQGKVEIIGIDCNDTKDAWQNAVARLELPWVSLYQPEGGKVSTQYNVSAFPTKVVIDPEGIIKKIYSGASPTFREDIANWIK